MLGAQKALTFNDVILLPSFTQIEPSEAKVSTNFTRRIRLNVPFASAPMDTVTESKMAIALARVGGIGILHRNCTIEEEVNEARKVKRAEALIIRDVITIEPDKLVREAIELMRKHNIHGLPVIEEGKLVGIVTWRDVRFANSEAKVKDVMSKNVITASEEISIEEAKRILHEHRIEKLPIVDKDGKLIGLITVRDIEGRGKYPNAVRDEAGRLVCGAAISPFDLERAKALDKWVDVLVIDVAHFHNENCMKATKKLLKEVESEIVVGNIGTYEACEDCITKLDGIAGLRVGIGSGSICTTGVVTKVAAPTLFAVCSVADACRDYGAKLPIIADGGIKTPGDVALALAAGASSVMMGNIFAGCEESPGMLVAIEGRYYKQYYGMGSHAARRKRMKFDRYMAKQIEEGVEGWVPFRGSVESVVREFVAGLKAAMGYVGARSIEELWEKAKFALVTERGMKEIKPHSLITPRY